MNDIKKDNQCSLCGGTHFVGNRITGRRPCHKCLDADEFKLKIKELGSADCVHCIGTGKGGDYITGFMPCTHCRGTGRVAAVDPDGNRAETPDMKVLQNNNSNENN